MPGPIGIGKKTLRTAVAAKRNRAAIDAGRREEGRTLMDNVQDYRTVKKVFTSHAASDYDGAESITASEPFFYSMAMDMCGNEGQRAIIASMGSGAFHEAANQHNEGGDAVGELLALCPHPEAVEEILMDVGSAIADEVEAQWGDGEGEW